MWNGTADTLNAKPTSSSTIARIESMLGSSGGRGDAQPDFSSRVVPVTA